MENIDLTIQKAIESDQDVWDDYVYNHPKGFAYQLFGWKKAVEGAYYFECPYFMAKNGSKLMGVFPLAIVKLPFGKGTLVSLPYCDAGGVLADSKIVAEMLLETVSRFAFERGIRNVEIRSIEPFEPFLSPVPPLQDKNSMILSLPSTSEELFSSFKTKLRTKLRKPEKDGLFCKMGGAELLDDFYFVFAENMRDLGSPVHSRKWFRSLLKAYKDKAKCCVVYMPDKTPAAGGIILCTRNKVSVPWSSSLRRLNRWRPNMLLYWNLLKYAADGGYDYFDFGRSTPKEGTYLFKRQWGAEPGPMFWARLESLRFSDQKVALKNLEQSSSFKKGRQAVATAIQKMPLSLSLLLGRTTRRFISL